MEDNQPKKAAKNSISQLEVKIKKFQNLNLILVDVTENRKILIHKVSKHLNLIRNFCKKLVLLLILSVRR